MKISGLAAVVTGGASGLGRATARKLAESGARVALFDLDEAAGRHAADAIGGIFVKADVADDESVAAAIRTAEAAHGIARIAVNCAGIAPAVKSVGRDNAPHPLDAFRKTIEVNLIGTFNVIAKCAARMAAADEIEGERGVIVNTASVAAYDGQIGQAAYSASKGGIVSMTLPIARDLAKFGIRINTILPGIFGTPLMNMAGQEMKDRLCAMTAFPNRFGEPDEYANLALELCRNAYMNAQSIRIDAGVRFAAR